MIGITIGIGPGWATLAHQSAARMSEMTGLRCHVVEHDPYACCHPSWLKCHMHRMFPEEDAFLIFDADILCVCPWDPERLFYQLGRPLMAVPEPTGNPELIEECWQWNLEISAYVNGGLIICGREHAPVWDRTWTYHPHGGLWLEQTAFNVSIVMEAVETCRLPRHFNLLAQKGRIDPVYARSTLRHAVNIHTCAIPDAQETIAHHQRLAAYLATGQAGRTRQDLLADLPRHSIGAEIGVFCGDFSRDILRIVQPTALHLVDLFTGQATSGDVDGRHMRTVDMDVVFQELNAIGSPVSVHRSDSLDWLAAVGADELDWIYLDTTHEYHRTLAELHHARRIVRPGGIIAGHDFSRSFPGVVQAVVDFLAEYPMPLQVYDGDILHSFSIRNADVLAPAGEKTPNH